jgi:hypothetical protein
MQKIRLVKGKKKKGTRGHTSTNTERKENIGRKSGTRGKKLIILHAEKGSTLVRCMMVESPSRT